MKNKTMIFKNEHFDVKEVIELLFVFGFMFLMISMFFPINSFIIIFILFMVLIGVLLLLEQIVAYFRGKKHKKLKRVAVRVDGYIERYERKISNKTTYYHLIVSYINPNTKQKESCKTPVLVGNPVNYLASRNCSVYFHGNYFFVSDLVEDLSGKKSVFRDPSQKYFVWSYEEKEKIQKKVGIIVLAFFVMFFIMFFIIFKNLI